MKTLNEFINESLHTEINESILNKIAIYYHKNIKNQKSVAELFNAVKKVVHNKYQSYGVEIKKASDIVNDKNCVTLNMDETTFTMTWDEAEGCDMYTWIDYLGSRGRFEDYYKKDPDAEVLCLYDKTDSKHLYSIMDLWMFGLAKDQGKWLHHNVFPSDSKIGLYIEHCIREIAAFKNPNEWKGGKYVVTKNFQPNSIYGFYN